MVFHTIGTVVPDIRSPDYPASVIGLDLLLRSYSDAGFVVLNLTEASRDKTTKFVVIGTVCPNSHVPFKY